MQIDWYELLASVGPVLLAIAAVVVIAFAQHTW